MGRRGLVAVAGDPDRAGQPLLPGPDRGLERAAGPVPVQLLQVADRVQLDQVDVVGLQPLQAAVDLGPGGVAVPRPVLVARKIRSRIPGIHGPSRSSASP